MMRRLVASPSVSSIDASIDMPNRPLIDELAGWLEDLGFTVAVAPLASTGGKANLVASAGSGSGGLVLAGHTDTVPFDEHAWHSDPFTLSERDARLYGLGTTDMKLFLAFAIEASREFDFKQLRRPLRLLATADEESSMAGAAALDEALLPRADCAVIGEPTGLKPVRAHKGAFIETIRLLGRSGHASDPRHGVSALDGMYEVLDELSSIRAELGNQFNDPTFEVPGPTMNFGRISGGDAPNRICASCELVIDVRTLPGMSNEAVQQLLGERIHQRLAGSGLEVHCDPTAHAVPAMQTAPDCELVRATEKLSGCHAGTAAFATEAPYLSALGMDVVVLGPGDVAQAHQPDEYLATDAIRPTVELLRQLVHQFCMR